MPAGEDSSVKRFATGTHRSCPPEETWDRIQPLFPQIGITRIADITGLDRLGIPVYCGIRPRGEILQTSNGKGLREVDARVSAAMEAIEQWHCEQRPDGILMATAHELSASRPVVLPQDLPMFRDDLHFNDDQPIVWVEAEDLPDGRTVWIPASAAWPNCFPALYTFSTNGLASGNTLTEATLHALYEIAERDTVTRQIRGGLRLKAPAAERVDPTTVGDSGVASLLERVRESGMEVALVYLRENRGLPTFWAALLDDDSLHPCTTVNFGYGVHLSPTVAAVRAITEAAQARLSFVHGVREDLAQRIRAATPERVRPVFQYFRDLQPTLDWSSIEDRSSADLREDLERVLASLGDLGPIYRIELTREDLGIPVVKIIAEGAIHDRRFF